MRSAGNVKAAAAGPAGRKRCSADADSDEDGDGGAQGAGYGSGGCGDAVMDEEQLREVVATLRADLDDASARSRFLEEELSRYSASARALAELSVEELAALEATLEDSVKAVRQAKERRLQEALLAKGGGDADAVSRTLCSVCLTRPKTILFLPCKHLCACSGCADRIMRPPGGAASAPRKEPMCPICRAPVEQVLDVYA
jgi:hypothetical protein